MNQKKNFALSGGGYCLFAPRFPRFLDAPGFVDDVLLANATLSGLFALSFLERSRPLHVHCRQIQIEQGRAILHHEDSTGLKVTERRFITQDDRLACELELHNASKADREITVIMWSTTDPEGEPVSLEGDSYRVRRVLKASDNSEVPTDIHFSSPDSKGARCLQGFFCEGGKIGRASCRERV